jgi:hypothetical protein
VRFALFLPAALACGSSQGLEPPANVGAACTPSAEQSPEFSGFDVREVTVDAGGCGAAVCLVNHFEGRVSCPFGQLEGEDACTVPRTDDPVVVGVSAQYAQRRAADTVYCSCRCQGPDPAGSYCECPDGFECRSLVPSIGVAPSIEGSYCIKAGTAYDPASVFGERCNETTGNCR